MQISLDGLHCRQKELNDRLLIFFGDLDIEIVALKLLGVNPMDLPDFNIVTFVNGDEHLVICDVVQVLNFEFINRSVGQFNHIFA